MPPTRLLAVLAALALLAATPVRAAEKLTVLLDWFVNPDHAALVVAREKGFFAKEGLDVTLVEPADPSAPPRLVAAGQGDVAVTYQPNLYTQVKEGLPLVRVGTAIATPLNSLVVLGDGPVKGLADLKGKTIGYSIAGFEDSPFSKQSWPALTTAKQATEDIARHAALRLIAELKPHSSALTANRGFSPQLVIRDSTARVRLPAG